MDHVNQVLNALESKSGDSFADLAVFLDTSPEVLNSFKKGQMFLTKSQVIKLASYLKIDTKEMLIRFQKDRISHELKNAHTPACNLQNGNVDSDLLPGTSQRLKNMTAELERIGKSELEVEVSKPEYPLNLYIESFMFCRGHHLDFTCETIVPDGSVQLIIELENENRTIETRNSHRQISLGNVWISGFQTHSYIYRHRISEKTLYINFRPGGLHAFTKVPQFEVTDTAVDAELLLGMSVLQLREQLIDEKTSGEILSRSEHYFRSRIPHQTISHQVVEYICRNIHVPLPRLVKKSGYSQKHLITLFKQLVGVTPKSYQRIQRFQKVLTHIHTRPASVSWPALALDHRYYDQAHFIKEFAAFSGVSPQKYLENGSTCPKFMFG